MPVKGTNPQIPCPYCFRATPSTARFCIFCSTDLECECSHLIADHEVLSCAVCTKCKRTRESFYPAGAKSMAADAKRGADLLGYDHPAQAQSDLRYKSEGEGVGRSLQVIDGISDILGEIRDLLEARLPPTVVGHPAAPEAPSTAPVEPAATTAKQSANHPQTACTLPLLAALRDILCGMQNAGYACSLFAYDRERERLQKIVAEFRPAVAVSLGS